MSPAAIARAARAHLVAKGSAEHAAGVQWFFKEAVLSHGWYAAPLRAYGRRLHRELVGRPRTLIEVADRLFAGRYLEEKVLAVVMLEPSAPSVRGARTRHGRFVLDDAEFGRFESWLDRVTSWADHDALAMILLGPLLVAHPGRVRRIPAWARARDCWHRRAAAVSLIQGIRLGLFTDDATRVTHRLVADADDMVQKGLGWLLREWGKARPAEVLPLLMEIRARAPRLVLRTACERLPAEDRTRVLG